MAGDAVTDDSLDGGLWEVAEGCHVRKGGCCAWREAVGEAELGHDSETTEEARLTCFPQGRIILIMMILIDLCDFVVHRGHWAPLGACAAHRWPRSRRRAFSQYHQAAGRWRG